ncbi:MAG: CAP domain-containing protein [Vicinamibacterales bacterium]
MRVGRLLGWLCVVVALCSCSVVPTESRADTFDGLSVRLGELINEDRRAKGLAPLRAHEGLRDAAYRKATDMVARRYFGHTDPDGRSPWVWFDRAGYRYLAAGENLARAQPDAQHIRADWMDSSAHRRNLLSPDYSDFGIAAVDDRGRVLVVAFFGHSGP